ncbi:MAG: cytochrome c3 family protein [Acidobacteriota bacterium]
MKKIALVLVFVAAAAVVVMAADIPADKEVLKLEAKLGTVTFKHKAHVDAGAACTDCHHTQKEGQPVQKCSECHDKAAAKDKAPKLQDAFHNNCAGCHAKLIAEGKKSGPVKDAKSCKSCHVKPTA